MTVSPPPVEAGQELALEAHILTSLSDVTAEAWDACVPDRHPFVRHAFLSALEESGSATAETGWLGQHVVLKDSQGTILGAVPMYLKNHSQGEYISKTIRKANMYSTMAGPTRSSAPADAITPRCRYLCPSRRRLARASCSALEPRQTTRRLRRCKAPCSPPAFNAQTRSVPHRST